MAKYIVLEKKTEVYETNYVLPLLNIAAGIVWSIPFVQKVFPDAHGLAALGIGFVFMLVYIILSIVPVIAIVPCVAAGILYTAMLWGFADAIGHIVIQWIVKIVALLIVILVEFSIFGNATLSWAQMKFSKPPRIIRLEDNETIK